MTNLRGWRENAIAGRWRVIDVKHVPDRDLPELLRRLKAVAVKKEIRNGLEVTMRYARPNEVSDPELRAVAEIMALGELEAAVEGEPPKATQSWADTREKAEAALREFSQSDADPEGDPELSRHACRLEALALLKQIDFETSAMQGEMPTDEDREWLAEVIAGVVELAFLAGVRFQQAWLKPFEGLAARKQEIDAQNRQSSQKGGVVQSGKAQREKELLTRLALSDAEFRKWIWKERRQQVTHLEQLADKLRKRHAEEKLFALRGGKPRSSTWFLSFLSELRTTETFKKAHDNMQLDSGKPPAFEKKTT